MLIDRPKWFVLDKLPGLAELPSVILAVDRNLEVGLVLDRRELDLEVEAGAGEDRSAVDRIDRLGGERAPIREKPAIITSMCDAAAAIDRASASEGADDSFRP